MKNVKESKHILLFEKFTIDKYLKKKKEEEDNLIQTLGDEFIIEIVENGDFDGLNYLLNTGYDLQECGANEHLLAVALNHNRYKMFNYLLKNYGDINTMALPDITRDKDNNDKPITQDLIDKLKFIAKKGFKFYDGKYSYFKLYLCDTSYKGWSIKRELLPFIDWLLENYPENYKYVKDILEDENLLNKYKYLENSDKYNL